MLFRLKLVFSDLLRTKSYLDLISRNWSADLFIPPAKGTAIDKSKNLTTDFQKIQEETISSKLDSAVVAH